MIKIKHDIKREGCSLKGHILDCKFSNGFHRGDWQEIETGDFKNTQEGTMPKDYKSIGSTNYPKLTKFSLFVWGNEKEKDLWEVFYIYDTEHEAQSMLDFINTFKDAEG